MSYLEELLPEFKKGAKIRCKYWVPDNYVNDVSFINCRPVRKDEVTFYEDTESTHPSIGSLYKGGIYIGEYNGKEVVMMLNDEKEEMIWVDAMNLEHRRPLSILEWQLYKENKEVIDEALEKYGEPLQGDEWCWSSSEYGSNGAWGFRPSDGAMYFGNANKNFSNRVRCVLAF